MERVEADSAPQGLVSQRLARGRPFAHHIAWLRRCSSWSIAQLLYTTQSLRRIMHARFAGFGVLALAATTACASGSQGAASLEACQGQRVAIVTNGSEQAADVYARQRGSDGAFLGSVQPGEQREFAIGDSSFVAIRSPAGLVARRDHAQLVRRRYACRRSQPTGS